MRNSLSKALSQVQHSAKRLNQLTEKANQTVKEVERFLLERCSVGIPASVFVSKTDSPDPIVTSLQYCRVGSRYRIVIVTRTEMTKAMQDAKPWSDCSREEKLDTIGKLPELMVALGKRIDEKIAVAEKGLDEVSEVLQSLSEMED